MVLSCEGRDGVGSGPTGQELTVGDVGAGMKSGRTVLAQHRGGGLRIRRERHGLDDTAEGAGRGQ